MTATSSIYANLCFRLDVARSLGSCSNANDFRRFLSFNQPVVLLMPLLIRRNSVSKFTLFRATSFQHHLKIASIVLIFNELATKYFAQNNRIALFSVCLFTCLFVCLFTRYARLFSSNHMYTHTHTHSVLCIMLKPSSIDVIIIIFNYSFRISTD